MTATRPSLQQLYSDGLMQLWEDYANARVKHEELKRATSDAHAAMRVAEGKFAEFLLDHGNPPIEIGGMKPYLSEEIGTSVTQENNADVRAWLTEKVGADKVSDYETIVLDGAAVKRLVRNEIKEGVDPTTYPDFLKVSVRPRLNVRGWDKD